jgi:hypothetical protein
VVTSIALNDQPFIFRATKPILPRCRLKTFQSGRTCSEPGCVTRLSIYNSHDECWLHGSTREYSLKLGRRYKKAA